MATKKQQTRIDEFNLIKNTLFPNGQIPPMAEIQERLSSGNYSVRDGLIARMYKNGVPVDPFLLKTDETKTFATAVEKAFPNPTKVARNIEGIAGIITKLASSKIPLDSSFNELEVASRSPDFSDDTRTKIVKPIVEDVKSVIAGDVKRVVTGTRKLAKGAIPIGVLEGVMKGIGDIPDPIIRDAVVASMLGYRGKDLSGIVTNAEQAEELYPARPYYDRESQVMMSPDAELPGGGRKGKGPDRPLGPVMAQIMNRRYDSAVDGELFPDVTTGKLTAALKKYVYPKIDENTLKLLKKAPSGYTDMRRIVASAIANQLGDPQAAAEIISHKGDPSELIDRTMTGFYTEVENLDSLEARRTALIGFEKLMADATGQVDAKGLGAYLRLDLDPEFNATYPEFKIKAGSEVASAIQVTPATPEQIEAGSDLSAARMQQSAEQARLSAAQSALEADQTTIERGKIAPEVAEAEAAVASAKKEQAETAKKAKKTEAAGKFGGILDDAIDMFGTDTSKLESSMLSAAGAAKLLSSVPMPPAADFMLSAFTDPASIDKAVEIGREKTRELLGGTSPTMEGLGGTAAVIGEVLGGGQVTDPERAEQSAKTMGTFAVSPLLGMMQQSLGKSKPGPEPQIQTPPPTQGTNLEAQQATGMVNQARRAAMQGEETSMTGSFLQPQI